jgi:hypothetical protein
MGSLAMHPSNFRNLGFTYFFMYLNRKQFPSEEPTLDLWYERKTVLGYKKDIQLPGIHHSNTGPQISTIC